LWWQQVLQMTRRRLREAEAEAVQMTEAAVEAATAAGVGTPGFAALHKEGIQRFAVFEDPMK
jgi:hypothetical protein